MEHETLIRLVVEEIEAGKFGHAGQPFLSVQELAKHYHIRNATANAILQYLRDNKYVTTKKRKQYLTHTRIYTDAMTEDEKKREPMIAVLYSNMYSYYMPPFIDALSKALRKHQYQMICIDCASADEEELRRILHLIHRICPAGLVVAVNSEELVRFFCKRSTVPCVTLDTDCTMFGADNIVTAGGKQAEKIAEYFLQQGCDNVLYVSTRNDKEIKNLRHAAFAKRLREMGMPCGEEQVLLLREFKENPKYITERLLTGSKTGVLCASEQVTKSLVRICAESGIQIPQTILVAGYRDFPGFYDRFDGVITIETNIATSAQLACEAIMSNIKEGKTKGSEILVEPVVTYYPQKVQK